MAESIFNLLFKVDHKDLDGAKEKLAGLGKEMPTIGQGIQSLADKFLGLPGVVGLAAGAAIGFVAVMDKLSEAGAKAAERVG